MTTTTTLLPVDPAVSPQQAARIISVRANLLPQEIVDYRRAKRTGIGAAALLVLVIGLIAVWYLHAANTKSTAEDEFNRATAQVSLVRGQQSQFKSMTQTKNRNKLLSNQLKTLLSADLPWATLLDEVRTAGSGVTVTGISGALLSEAEAKSAAAGTEKSVATLTITGSADDKKAVARYVEDLDELPRISNAYLTTATQNGNRVDFTLTANVTDQALCGSFTTPCKSGGN